MGGGYENTVATLLPLFLLESDLHASAPFSRAQVVFAADATHLQLFSPLITPFTSLFFGRKECGERKKFSEKKTFVLTSRAKEGRHAQSSNFFANTSSSSRLIP